MTKRRPTIRIPVCTCGIFTASRRSDQIPGRPRQLRPNSPNTSDAPAAAVTAHRSSEPARSRPPTKIRLAQDCSTGSRPESRRSFSATLNRPGHRLRPSSGQLTGALKGLEQVTVRPINLERLKNPSKWRNEPSINRMFPIREVQAGPLRRIIGIRIFTHPRQPHRDLITHPLPPKHVHAVLKSGNHVPNEVIQLPNKLGFQKLGTASVSCRDFYELPEQGLRGANIKAVPLLHQRKHLTRLVDCGLTIGCHNAPPINRHNDTRAKSQYRRDLLRSSLHARRRSPPLPEPAAHAANSVRTGY